MAIKHNGFTVSCAVGGCERTFTSAVETVRTFVAHARTADWFIGRVVATPAPPGLRAGSRRVQLCPIHRWIVLP